MTNFEKCRQEMKIEDVGEEWNAFCQAVFRVRNEKDCSERSCASCNEWLKQEYKEPILDCIEKEYLHNIIKPFKNKVWYITKTRDIWHDQYEKILINITRYDSSILLPRFKKGTMYKGMKLDKQYSLEELGL